MRCGKCKAQPTTVEHVRECYGIGTTPATVDTAPEHDELDMTEKQYNFIINLLEQKGVEEGALTDYFGFVVTDCLKDEASQVIKWLLSRPDKDKPKTAKEDEAYHLTTVVPPGRYALFDADRGKWVFYQVDKPTEGKWAGYTFLSVLASDERHPIRGRAQRGAVLARIAVDPRGAMIDYGRQVGRCGRCGRTLTDPESIAAGIGPVCAESL